MLVQSSEEQPQALKYPNTTAATLSLDIKL